MGETVLHVVDSISEEASGPSYSVPRLCGALAAQGSTVRLVTVGDRDSSFVGFEHEAYSADFSACSRSRPVALLERIKIRLNSHRLRQRRLFTCTGYGVCQMSIPHPWHRKQGILSFFRRGVCWVRRRLSSRLAETIVLDAGARRRGSRVLLPPCHQPPGI